MQHPQLGEPKGAVSPVRRTLQPSCAAVAVEDCSHRAGAGIIPIPCLAFGCVALSGARILTIGGHAEDVNITFIMTAPINIGALFIKSDAVSDAVIAALMRAPCHWQLTQLRVRDPTDAVALLCRQLTAVRFASITGRGAVKCVVDAPHLQATLRRLVCMYDNQATAMDLFSFTRLRQLGFATAEECYRIATVKLPPSLRRVGERSCRACAHLATIDLSATAVSELPSQFGSRCELLRDVTFPPCLTAVRDNAFFRCSSLRRIDFTGTRLQSVGRHFANGCDALLEVAFPPVDVTRRVAVDIGAFQGCPNSVVVTPCD
jgi:hypothetical protein